MRCRPMGIAAALALLAVGAATATAQEPRRFDSSELAIEINATDGDAGLQMSVGGRAGAPRLTTRAGGRSTRAGARRRRRRPGRHGRGRRAAVRPRPFRRSKARFPAGRYRSEATGADGRRVIGSDRLTHVAPAGPRVLAPAEDATVVPAAFVVGWQPVTRPQEIWIVLLRGDHRRLEGSGRG